MSTSAGSNTPGAGWATPSLSVFQLGKGKTLAIPMSTHHASRQKLANLLQVHHGINEGVVLLKGGEEGTQYDSDTDLLFRCVSLGNISLSNILIFIIWFH